MLRQGRLILFTALALLMGCSALVPTAPGPQKDKHLRITYKHPEWDEVDPRQSDRAWSHHRRGDVMLANSFCGEFQSLPLEALARQTFESYGGYIPLGKRTLEWQGREAFEMEIQANVDGVGVLIYLRNYRRDHCYYDFLLITPRERNRDSLAAFEAMLKTVRFR